MRVKIFISKEQLAKEGVISVDNYSSYEIRDIQNRKVGTAKVVELRGGELDVAIVEIHSEYKGVCAARLVPRIQSTPRAGTRPLFGFTVLPNREPQTAAIPATTGVCGSESVNSHLAAKMETVVKELKNQ